MGMNCTKEGENIFKRDNLVVASCNKGSLKNNSKNDKEEVVSFEELLSKVMDEYKNPKETEKVRSNEKDMEKEKDLGKEKDLDMEKAEKKKDVKKEEKARLAAKRFIEAKLAGLSSELSPMHQFLYCLVYKDPSILSLSEKSLMHLEDSNTHTLRKDLSLNEFQKLLNGYNININKLTFVQIAKLAQLNSKPEVMAFLQTLKKEIGKESTSEKSDEERLELLNLELQEKENILMPINGSLSLIPQKESFQKFQLEKANEISDEEFVAQVLNAIAVRRPEELTEVVIKLQPEHLGSLRLMVKVNKDHGTEAHFEAESEFSRNLIESNLDDLKSALSRHGLKINKLTVVNKFAVGESNLYLERGILNV